MMAPDASISKTYGTNKRAKEKDARGAMHTQYHQLFNYVVLHCLQEVKQNAHFPNCMRIHPFYAVIGATNCVHKH